MARGFSQNAGKLAGMPGIVEHYIKWLHPQWPLAFATVGKAHRGWMESHRTSKSERELDSPVAKV